MNRWCIKFLSEKCPFNAILIKGVNSAWLFVFMRFQKMSDFHFVRKCPKQVEVGLMKTEVPAGFETIFLSERVVGQNLLGQILGQNNAVSDKFSDKIEGFGKLYKSCIKPCIQVA